MVQNLIINSIIYIICMGFVWYFIHTRILKNPQKLSFYHQDTKIFHKRVIYFNSIYVIISLLGLLFGIYTVNKSKTDNYQKAIAYFQSKDYYEAYIALKTLPKNFKRNEVDTMLTDIKNNSKQHYFQEYNTFISEKNIFDAYKTIQKIKYIYPEKDEIIDNELQKIKPFGEAIQKRLDSIKEELKFIKPITKLKDASKYRKAEGLEFLKLGKLDNGFIITENCHEELTQRDINKYKDIAEKYYIDLTARYINESKKSISKDAYDYVKYSSLWAIYWGGFNSRTIKNYFEALEVMPVGSVDKSVSLCEDKIKENLNLNYNIEFETNFIERMAAQSILGASAPDINTKEYSVYFYNSSLIAENRIGGRRQKINFSCKVKFSKTTEVQEIVYLNVAGTVIVK